jgi:hypothetical protein
MIAAAAGAGLAAAFNAPLAWLKLYLSKSASTWKC